MQENCIFLSNRIQFVTESVDYFFLFETRCIEGYFMIVG